MAGQGKRLKSLDKNKFLIPYKNKPIYKHVLSQYNSKKNIIITNNELKKKVLNQKSVELFFVEKNNSMFKTILESSKLLNAHDKYILTSCDCFGEFDIKKLKNISKKKIDLCLFGFKFSNLQTKLNNAHTQIVTEKHAVKDIKVKSKYNSCFRTRVFFGLIVRSFWLF